MIGSTPPSAEGPFGMLPGRWQLSLTPPPPPGGGGAPPPPPPGGGGAPPPPPPGVWAPPPPPRDPQAELLRASVELDGAYRDLRRAEIMVTQLEETYPGGVESQHARAIIDMATTLYMESQRAYQAREGFRAAEYAVAVRDLMRAVDKFYNAAINSR